MITRDFYEAKMREAIALLDSRISKKTVDLIYEKIKDNFENEDFAKAIVDITESDNLSYPFLLKLLRQYSSVRLEQEEKERKKKEEEETRQFWKANYHYIKEGICNRKCYECPVQLCDLIANRSIDGIKAILTKEKTLEQVNTELAKEFPGVGFETGNPELQPF